MSQPASTVAETSKVLFDDTPLPDGWRWVRLGDMSEVISKGTTPTTLGYGFTTSGIPFLRAEDVNGGAVDVTQVAYHISNETHETLSRSQLRSGDLLITIAGTLGRVGYVPNDSPPLNCNQAVAFARLNPKTVDVEYACFACQSQQVLRSLTDLRAGGIIQNLNLQQVQSLLIPLPPLPEQKRIASILKEQITVVEQARAAAEAQLKAAKVLPIAYLRAVFENEEAQRWSRKQLNELGELLPAKSIATEGDTQVTAITTACLTESGFQPLGVKTARMSAKDAELCKVSYGEILLARSNTSELVGRAAMFSGEPENAIASDLTIRFLPYSLDFSPFLAAYLSFLYATGYWKERAGGASGSMKKITRPQVLQLSVPIPSATVQSKVAGELSEQMQSSKRLMFALSKQLDDIKQLPAALLRQAFTGKL